MSILIGFPLIIKKRLESSRSLHPVIGAFHFMQEHTRMVLTLITDCEERILIPEVCVEEIHTCYYSAARSHSVAMHWLKFEK